MSESEGQTFIAMEFVEGETLSSRIPAEGLPVETLLDYGAQIAAGLEHAHGRGVIHRDLKSSNVRLTRDGRCKILDFGLAERVAQADAVTAEQSDATPGSNRGVSGTLSYMAPETLRGEPPDARSDLWALGVILYEMAAGSLPFRGATGFAVSTAILRDPPAALPDRVQQGVRDVVRRSLAKELSGRYQSAGELRAALEAVHSGHRGTRQGAPGAWRRARVFAAAVFALLVTATAGYFAWRQLVPRPATHHLAILPVLPPESDAQTTSLSHGLEETVNARLAHTASRLGILLVPPSEVHARRVASLQDARDQFGVDLCIEFSLHQAGELVRVTYSLVDTASFRQLEAGTLTAGMGNPLVLEDQLADRVVTLVSDFVKNESGRPGGSLTSSVREAGPAGTSPPGTPSAVPPDVQASSAVEAMKAELSATPGAEHGAAAANAQARDLYRAGSALLSERYNSEATERAIASLRQAIALDARFSPAYAGLGEAYWLRYEQTKDRHWVSQAQAACRKSVSLQPDTAVGYECLGMISTGTGNYEAAVAQCQKALALNPSSARASFRLAEAFERLGSLQDAEQSYRRAVSQEPNSAVSYNRLGAFYLRHGRFADAAQMFSEVVALSPTSIQGYSNLGGTYVAQGRYLEDIPQFELSVSIQPTAQATSNLGTAYFHLRRYAESARAFEQAVKLDGKNYVVWGNLGDAYYWAPGRRADSAAAYRKAVALAEESLKVNSRDANLFGYLATYHAMLGERVPALTALENALRLGSHDADVLSSTALVYNQLGDTGQALAFIEKALAAGAPPISLRDLPNFDSLRANTRFQQILGRNPSP